MNNVIIHDIYIAWSQNDDVRKYVISFFYFYILNIQFRYLITIKCVHYFICCKT